MLRRRGRPPYPGPLTPAEERVLQFVREGMPNAEIAVRLGVSVNTVRYHVSNLLAKAGVESREELVDWRPRSGPSRRWFAIPALGLPAKVALAAVSVAAVAVVAVSVVARFDDDDGGLAASTTPPPPEGYERPAAADLEARGFTDAGLLFVPLEGESPLLGMQLRQGFTAVQFTGGLRLNLGVDPEHWRHTGFVISGVNAELIGTADGHRYVLRMASGRPVNGRDTATRFDHPAGGDAFISAGDGEPEITISVHRSPGPVYSGVPNGSAQHAAAIDERGHLFISREPLPANIVVDQWTGWALDKSEAMPAGRLGDALAGYPFTGCSEQATGVSAVAANILQVPTRCSVSLRTALHLYAPTAGTVSCESEDVLLLATPDYTLRFTWANTGYGGPPGFDCTERPVAAGEIIGPNRHYVISATGPNGEDLAVGATLDRHLFVGDFGLLPSMECPCRWGH